MPDELEDLMSVYSRRGVTEWKEAKQDLRTKAGECLLNQIATDEDEIKSAISASSTVQKFIPMPCYGSKQKGFEWSFFFPKRRRDGQMMSLVLFIFVNRARKNSVAFRFESSSGDRHGYSHVQLTSKLPELGLAPSSSEDEVSWGVPQWLPDSYPAFPIVARNWTEMFLAMAVAVHGRHGGFEDLIREIFREQNRPNDAQKYKDMLDEMLCELKFNSDF